jgi:hypothetical protein
VLGGDHFDWYDTLSVLKEKLEEKMGFPVSAQEHFRLGKLLDNEWTLMDGEELAAGRFISPYAT